MTRRALARRVNGVQRVVQPAPPPSFLAYARAVVAYGGGDPVSEASVTLACWLAGERRQESLCERNCPGGQARLHLDSQGLFVKP
jgi:hypothetical protein